MNYFKNFMVLINSREKIVADINIECENATVKIVSLFPLVEENSFNANFEKALNVFSNGNFQDIDDDNMIKFMEVFKEQIQKDGLQFQCKDTEEQDYVFNGNDIVEIKTSRYAVLQDMVLKSLNAPDYSNGTYYFERLLGMIKRKAIRDMV